MKERHCYKFLADRCDVGMKAAEGLGSEKNAAYYQGVNDAYYNVKAWLNDCNDLDKEGACL